MTLLNLLVWKQSGIRKTEKNIMQGETSMTNKDETVNPDDKLDLSGVLCPINFVQTKLKLEELELGQVLEVILDDGEPMRNVPRSIKAEGQRIIGVEKLPDDTYRLLICKESE